MGGHGQRHRPGSTADPKPARTDEGKQLSGGAAESDRAWAQNHIRNYFAVRRDPEFAKQVPYAAPFVQRKAACTGDWRTRFRGSPDDALVAAKHGQSAAVHGGAAIPQSGGAPLPGDVRGKMEPQLGGDLSAVKVHTGNESEKAAADLGARAFTVGQDVHFGGGEFAPGTKEGDRLLAHELAHTVQAQKSGVQRKAEEQHDQAEGAKATEVSQPGDPAEQEADAVADHATESLHGGAGGESKAVGGEQKKQGTEQEAPEIGAKLDGVGRKIHLAPKQNRTDPKKNPADAAVKRMGRSGQDKQQVKASLGKIAHERAAAVEELTQLQGILPTIGLPRVRVEQAKVSVQTALNALNHHLSDADITGAMRDTVGDPVRQPGSGKEFDHLDEVQGAVASLVNTRTNLTRLRTELARRQTDPKILAEKLDPALNALTNVVQSVGQALKKMQP